MSAQAKTPIHVFLEMPAWTWEKCKTEIIKTEQKTVRIIFHTVCILCYWPYSELLGVSTIIARHPGHIGLVHLRGDRYWRYSMRTCAWGTEKLIFKFELLTIRVAALKRTRWFAEIRSARSPSTMTTVPALTVTTRFVAKHSQPPWWSLLSGCSRREPLAITVYRERGVGPICEEGQEQVTIRQE